MRLSVWLLLAMQVLVASACLAQGGAPAPTQPTPPAQPAPPPLLPIIPFEDAVLRAAIDLFTKAQIPAESADRVAVVIDPLIDGVTAAQSAATRSVERRIVDLVRLNYPRFEIRRFSSAEIARKPVVLIGTFTAVNNAGVANAPKDAYRICLALADLASRRIIAKGVARAALDGVDPTPTPSFDEAPVFARDPGNDGYIRSCQGTRPGDPVDPGYADRIEAAALIADAVEAYDSRRYATALRLYRQADEMPGGDTLRTLNGLYLASLHLGRDSDTAQAFGRLVQAGLATDRLAVKFLFRPGSTLFDPRRGGQRLYRMWIAEIAGRVRDSSACLEIVGHTSATGPQLLNERLSALRADLVKDRLAAADPALTNRMIAWGAGSKQMIVGTGRDDASDALDRRVEFRVIRNCSIGWRATALRP